MKKKLTVMILALAVIASSLGVSFAGTKGSISLKPYLEGVYKIFVVLAGGQIGGSNGGGADRPESKPESKPESRPESDGQQEGQDNLHNEAAGKAKEILLLVNDERSKAGLPPLKLSDRLGRAAQIKAEDMAKNGYFSHNSPTYGSPFDLMQAQGISYRTAGENIAKGQKTARSVMSGWMSSQGHRENILKKEYKELGVGYAVDSRGTPHWVQMFIG